VARHAGRAEKSDYLVQDRFIALNFAFPDDKNAPACSREQILITFVPFDVVGELRLPELVPRLWDIGLPATVPVPEASVDENYCAPSREYQIRAAGKYADMRTKAIIQGVKSASDEKLRFRVHTSYAAHEVATFLWRQDIGHPRLSAASLALIKRGALQRFGATVE